MYIYLASPYTHKDKMAQEERFQVVLKYVSERTMAGEVIFSPIIHSHPMTWHGLKGTWDFWARIDHAFIDGCSKLRVLQMDGWDKSVGIKAEIEYATTKGKEVEYATV